MTLPPIAMRFEPVSTIFLDAQLEYDESCLRGVVASDVLGGAVFGFGLKSFHRSKSGAVKQAREILKSIVVK